MGKDDAPQGPDFNALLSRINKYVTRNNQLFKEAMKFGKNQFSKGEEWAQKLEQFGMDASGRLNQSAEEFKATTADRVAGLDQAGAAWGQQAADIYGQNKALATDVTGKLLPGMGQAAELGGEMLSSYQQQGIPFQDEYIAKLAGWDTTGRREDRAAQAVNDIAMTSDAARESELRRLETFGIDPSQTRSAALDSRLRAADSIAKATAANLERQKVEQEGIQAGGVASDMYTARMAAGLGSIESAGQQGRAIAEIARQPGADYMQQLTALGQYGIGVGQLEQAGGAAGFDMSNVAAGFGERGKIAGANQFNTAANYGSNVYDQARTGLKTSTDMLSSGYTTAGGLHANDLAAHEANQKNSFGGQIGELAGIAAPFVMDAFMPGSGTALRAATGGMFGGAKKTPAAGGPLAGTNLQNSLYSKGGAIPESASPSHGKDRDDVPAMIDAGEYVVDRDTVKWFGEKHFADLQKKAKQGRGIPEAA